MGEGIRQNRLFVSKKREKWAPVQLLPGEEDKIIPDLKPVSEENIYS